VLEFFLAGLRSIRSSFLTGAVILASLFVLIWENSKSAPDVIDSARELLDLNAVVPPALLALACFFTGSLYTTALEGLVDRLHQRMVLVDLADIHGQLRRRIVGAFVPLSVPARRRLIIEAHRFYTQFGTHSARIADDPAVLNQTDFVNRSLTDVLWMDGKLTGSPLKDRYDEYRADGELRLSLGLLLPLAALAVCRAIQLDAIWVGVTVLVTLCVAVMMCDYGLYYYRRAHSFLAHHVADGAVLTPTMETLKRAGPP
jgi:hypothetical protein